jgi:hypothetical protein
MKKRRTGESEAHRSYPKTSADVKTWVPAFAGMIPYAALSVMPAQAGIQGWSFGMRCSEFHLYLNRNA